MLILVSAENWKEALHVAKTLRGIATGGELEVVDAKQKAFRDVLLDQVGSVCIFHYYIYYVIGCVLCRQQRGTGVL